MSITPSPDAPLAYEARALLEALRGALQGAGYTQARAADALGISVATLRRWLAGQGVTFEKLVEMCRLAGVSLSELVEEAARKTPYEPLTLAQEQALTRDPGLSTVFFVLAAGWPASEATDGFGIPPDVVEKAVERLHRLALVDKLPGGRLRARLNPGQVWTRKPLLKHFDRHMKQYFFDADYSSPDVIFGLETMKLTPLGLARLQELIQEFRARLREIADHDRRQAHLPRQWYGVLAVARALDGLRYRSEEEWRK